MAKKGAPVIEDPKPANDPTDPKSVADPKPTPELEKILDILKSIKGEDSTLLDKLSALGSIDEKLEKITSLIEANPSGEVADVLTSIQEALSGKEEPETEPKKASIFERLGRLVTFDAFVKD